MSVLKLKISTPIGVKGPFECDSVHLPVSDDKEGRGGGLYGVRYGHTDAVLALDEGKIEAFLKSDVVFCGLCSSGFATVGKDMITVVVDRIQEGENYAK